MNGKKTLIAPKEVKRKMSGWLIALIVIAVLALGGVIFREPISRACNAAGNTQAETAAYSEAENRK